MYLAAPYLDMFPDWQRRAAFISATLLARATTADEKTDQVAELRALIVEVEQTHLKFEEEVGSEIQHVRIDDVRRAFDRLLSILRTTLP